MQLRCSAISGQFRPYTLFHKSTFCPKSIGKVLTVFVYFSLGDQYYSLDSKSLFFEHFLLEEESGFLCCEDGGKSSSVTTEKPG